MDLWDLFGTASVHKGVCIMGRCQLLAFPTFPSKMRGNECDKPESRGAGRVEIPLCQWGLGLLKTEPACWPSTLRLLGLHAWDPYSRRFSSAIGTYSTPCREDISLGRGLESATLTFWWLISDCRGDCWNKPEVWVQLQVLFARLGLSWVAALSCVFSESLHMHPRWGGSSLAVTL